MMQKLREIFILIFGSILAMAVFAICPPEGWKRGRKLDFLGVAVCVIIGAGLAALLHR